MKIDVEIYKRDLAFLILYMTPKLRSTYVILGSVSVFIFLVIYYREYDNAQELNVPLAIGASILGALGGFVAMLLLNLIVMFLRPRDTAGVLGHHSYELTPEGLLEETEYNSSTSSWAGVKEIITTKNYLLIGITGNLFHVIPKRSFDTESDFKVVTKKAHEYWDAAV